MDEVRFEMTFMPTYRIEDLFITAYTHTHENRFVEVAYYIDWK
jgi:hypothetical protein